MERLKGIKESLISIVQTQMGNWQNVDAQELGEVVDMVKDIEEAIYYCTITKAMNEKKENEKKEEMYYSSRMYPRMMEEWEMEPQMYYGGRGMAMQGRRNYDGGRTMSDGGAQSNMNYRMYTEREYPGELMRDSREGRSPMSRKTYMEGQEMHKEEPARMKDLEHYMMELSQDMTDMIKNASVNEKNVLKQKLTELVGKIK